MERKGIRERYRGVGEKHRGLERKGIRERCRGVERGGGKIGGVKEREGVVRKR